LNQIVLRKKIIQSPSTDSISILNNSTSSKQDNQQSFEQKQILIQNPKFV